MRLSCYDLVCQELSCDETQRRSTVAESDVVAGESGKLAEDRLSVTRDRLRTDTIGVESKAGIAFENRRCFGKEALNRGILDLVGAVWIPDDFLFRPCRVEYERARGRGPHSDAGSVQNSLKGNIDG